MRRLLREKMLLAGLFLLGALLLLAILGPFIIDPHQADVGAGLPRQYPSAQHFLGTDTQGRDVATTLVLATP